MFTQAPEKIEKNPLRQMLIEKGHSVRSAAREMRMSPSYFCSLLSSYDKGEAFAKSIKALPKREPAKMKTLRRATKRGPQPKSSEVSRTVRERRRAKKKATA